MRIELARLGNVVTVNLNCESVYDAIETYEKISQSIITGGGFSISVDGLTRVTHENWCERCKATSPNNLKCGVCDGPITQRKIDG